jgi:hypothetical protein
MKRVCCLFAMILLSSTASASADGGRVLANNPAQNQFLKEITEYYAERVGESGLANALETGTVGITYGDSRPSPVAVTVEGATGQPLIVINPRNSINTQLLGAIHEWDHIDTNDARGEPQTDAEKTQLYCDEVSADCRALKSYSEWYAETGRKLPCADKTRFYNHLANANYKCTNGWDASSGGIISQPSCPGFDPAQVPCR